MIDIDAAKCKQAGISPNDILTTLQGYYGGIYASNFNRFGKLYRVMIQADPRYRINPESLQKRQNPERKRNGTDQSIYDADKSIRSRQLSSVSICLPP